MMTGDEAKRTHKRHPINIIYSIRRIFAEQCTREVEDVDFKRSDGFVYTFFSSTAVKDGRRKAHTKATLDAKEIQAFYDMRRS
jgi:hypothetical protein